MKKSEWFKGLLFAEEMAKAGVKFLQAGADLDTYRGAEYYVRFDGKYLLVHYDFQKGVVDYQEHLKRLGELK